MKFKKTLVRGLAIAGFLVSAAYAGQGRVVSTMDSAGYTYIEVEQNGNTVWIASEPVKVIVGQDIQFEEYSLMTLRQNYPIRRT